jgi:hypothetical protein
MNQQPITLIPTFPFPGEAQRSPPTLRAGFAVYGPGQFRATNGAGAGFGAVASQALRFGIGDYRMVTGWDEMDKGEGLDLAASGTPEAIYQTAHFPVARIRQDFAAWSWLPLLGMNQDHIGIASVTDKQF